MNAGSTGFEKFGMIENVEEVSPNLHGNALRKNGVLVEREVPLFEGGAGERVAT